MDLKLLILLIHLTIAFSNPVKDDNKLGCLVCHPVETDKINVHLIPHSHDDVGWLKTVDQYYYGMKNKIQQAGVQYIITSVYEALLENKDRRFTQVETAFFWQWWKNQDEETRKKYRSLVENGQIEMANGAWSMNDEACVNYQSTIDQFTWGLRTLSETVGDCGRPRIGWQIDPFGHSREQASLLGQLGYDAMIFSRLDHDDKDTRMNNRTMDFAWRGSQNLDNSVIFGSTFATDIYFPPSGFCWDYKCADDVIDDNPNSPDYNLGEIVEEFTDLIKHQYAKYFPTNNIIIPMGGDFQFEAAEKNFGNMDKFIKAFRTNKTDLNVFYSTPSCYVKSVHDSLDKQNDNLVVKLDDFFPYSNDNHSFWTGYFSSRPNSKRFERTGHNVLQVTKQLYAQNSILTNKTYDDNLRYLREMMGVMQHHDAITGTEKQHVASDYVRRLTKGIEDAEKDLGEIVNELLGDDLKLNLKSCHLSNISICNTEDQFIVTIYNPLAWNITHYVRLPVDKGTYEINGGEVPNDVIPAIHDFDYVPWEVGKPKGYDLVFAAKNLPPMGLQIYHVRKTSNSLPGQKQFDSSTFKLNSTSNLLETVTFNGKTYYVSQTFQMYYSANGKYDGTYTNSGAYLFRPSSSKPEELGNVEISYSVKGNVVDEVHQKWKDDNADISQIIRWYHDEDYLEFDWLIGNINLTEKSSRKFGGKEFITKFTVTDDFSNNNTFYTDSNGREMIQRKLNQRWDYTYDPTYEPVASNYYPVTSKIVMKDELKDMEVAVLNDRSQGGSSLDIFSLELMLHRRLLYDDNKGVAENLNEIEFMKPVYVRGSHYLVVGSTKGQDFNGKSTAAVERILAQKKLVQPWIGVSSINKTYEEIRKSSNLRYEGLKSSLPENVNILTFEPWSSNQYLLRLEHIMEKNEDKDLSTPTTIDLKNAFKHFNIKNMTETTLGANELLSDFNKRGRYIWVKNDKESTKSANVDDDAGITLQPMQIRTFIVELGGDEPTSFGLMLKPAASLLLFVTLLVNML
ncbi:unnamed protein product [Phyllotreta striolata]|uniref:Alpha-mannosidase n=1 Tax=Phyllotreta striolata TaxID=444603 RepID=A0A9N9TD51_PHYSR|nr:unnamed protein product [Phyllotreta striolata]